MIAKRVLVKVVIRFERMTLFKVLIIETDRQTHVGKNEENHQTDLISKIIKIIVFFPPCLSSYLISIEIVWLHFKDLETNMSSLNGFIVSYGK